MKITAAVVRERGGAFALAELDLCDPRADELLVEVAASGMCATDLHGRDGYYAEMPYPAVFGHEGAGVVRAVGSAVKEFRPGDHVVMSYPWCGTCPNCRIQRQTYCLHAGELKHGGTRADGSTLHAMGGKPVYSAFFQQSSFGNYAIANERFAVKVRNDAPLEMLGPLACGGQTGAGAVLNVMKPKTGDSIVVFGAGSVGLSALMAAKIAGCDPIIADGELFRRCASGEGFRLARDRAAIEIAPDHIGHEAVDDAARDRQRPQHVNNQHRAQFVAVVENFVRPTVVEQDRFAFLPDVVLVFDHDLGRLVLRHPRPR